MVFFLALPQDPAPDSSAANGALKPPNDSSLLGLTASRQGIDLLRPDDGGLL